MVNTNTLYFGEKVRKVREFKGIHRRYVAKQLNISLTAYGNIERGKTKHIPYERKKQISQILNTPLDILESLNTYIEIDNILSPNISLDKRPNKEYNTEDLLFQYQTTSSDLSSTVIKFLY